MRIRFILESSGRYTMQRKRFWRWCTETYTISTMGGSYKEAFRDKNKDELLKSVLKLKYNIHGGIEITEYPTIIKYEPFNN